MRRILFLIGLWLAVFPVLAEAAHVVLSYDSSKPQIAFAAGDIRKALAHHGHTFRATPLAEIETTTSDLRIVLATLEDHQALDRHARDGGVTPSGLEAQGFALRTTENPTKAFWVLGGDSSGVMYGGLELAKKLHVHNVTGSWNFQQNAFIKKRGIKFNIALDKNNRTYIQKDGPTWNTMIHAVWDIRFWEEYFDEMARARYNLISFWSHHPFTAMMKAPGYENAVQADVYDYQGLVKKMTLAGKTAFWKRVHRMADDRGIEVYWMTWNIHLSGADGKYGLHEKEITPANVAYIRKTMTQFLVEFPLVKGFIVHAGENFNEDNRALRAEFMWNAYGLGIQDYQQQYDPDKQRDFTFVYRLAEGSTETIEKYFDQLVYKYDFSIKYPWAHVFAHPAPTLYKSYKGENVVDHLKASGRRMWLNLRNDDLYFQSWGNYEFARSYILNFPHEQGDSDRERYVAGYYMGSDGNTMTRLWYAKDESLNGMLEFHKHWYMHYAFGYAGYDPHRTEEDFLDIMRMKYPGVSVEALNDYWSSASRALCMANTMVTHSHSWRADWQWWPEGCFRKGGWGSIAEFADQKPQNGSEDPVLLPKGSDWSPRGLCGFDEYKKGTCGTRETPDQWGNRIMSYALQGLQVSSMSSEGDELLGLIMDDIKSMSWLGFFYSGHIRATAHHLKGEKAEAIAAAAQAYTGWKRYAELMDRKYKERVHNRVRFSGDFTSKLEYALRDYHYVGGEGIPEDKADVVMEKHRELSVIAGLNALSLGQASVRTRGDELIISTGIVEGRWKWTGKGFVTSGFKHVKTKREWVTETPHYAADWDVRLFAGDPVLRSLKAELSTDDQLTREHLRIIAEMEYPMPEALYPNSGLRIRFEIWAYPKAPGLRTQLFLGNYGQWVEPGIASSEDYRIDYLPLSVHGLKRQTVGFYNNHDGRNADDLDFVENRTLSGSFPGREDYPSANMVFFFDQSGGVALVKESHKVVNKPGVNTGAFKATSNGIESTGWGAALAYLKRGSTLPCWASWRLCWDQGEEQKQLALKVFDRMRYPLSEEEIVLTCNVWGGGQRSAGAKEDNILKEIKSCAELGIDVLQIDAGWQDSDPQTPPWEPKPEAYPTGWGNIMALAEQSHVRLGIWTRADDVIQHPGKLVGLYDRGFHQFKIDIGSWSTYDYLHKLTSIARDLKKHSQQKATINWDVTHKGLRVGYLYNREYGNLFLQNRRLPFANEGPGKESHTYVPRRILKDQWRAADYLNLNQIMFNVQTTEFVHPKMSNARLYGDVYSFAVAMMSAPLFFTETWRYSPQDRAAVKSLMSIYKKHRDDLYNGYVFAIGELPNDASWTGFQNYHPDANSGYLTLFREIDNKEKEKAIQLRFLRNQKILIEDLVNGDKKQIHVDEKGYVLFEDIEPASFKFYKYRVGI